MTRPLRRRAALLLPMALLPSACSRPAGLDVFEGDGPELRPDLFFEGRTVSYGVFEDRGGAPTSRFATDGVGVRERDGALALDQTVRLGDGEVIRRRWRLRRVEANRYEATGPAIAGTAFGETRGRAFRLSYTETLPPGGWHRTFRFDHWMYLTDDGAALVNRFTLRKLGMVVARATEVFARLA